MIQSHVNLRSDVQISRQGISGISAHLTQINATLKHGFGTIEKTILQGFHQVALQLGDEEDPLPTEASFYFLIALNALDDIVLDQTFEAERANESLHTRLGQKQFYDRRLDSLPDYLQEAFANLFRDFGSNDFSERIDRFIEINQLRRQLLWCSDLEMPQEAPGTVGVLTSAPEQTAALPSRKTTKDPNSPIVSPDLTEQTPTSSEQTEGDISLPSASESTPKTSRRKR